MKHKNKLLFNLPLIFACMAAMAMTVGQASAHTLFIQSSRYKVDKGASKPMFFGWGHHIPFDDGIAGKKLKTVKVIGPSGDIREVFIKEGRGLHSSLVEYEESGTYCLTAQTNQGYYTIYKDKKGRERHVVKPKSMVRDAEKIIMSLLSFQSAKTYVVSESPSNQIPEPAGMPLELVPLKELFRIKPGDILPIEILYKGKPFKGKGEWSATFNGYSTASEDYLYHKKEISGSSFQVPINRSGIWFVRYSFKIEATGDEKEKCSHFKHGTSLVFQVSPVKNLKPAVKQDR